jgi:hypothetical protein
MVFGLPMSSPRLHEPPAELPAMPPPTAICARCDTTVVLAGTQLPHSWAIVDGEPVCGDCRSLGLHLRDTVDQLQRGDRGDIVGALCGRRSTAKNVGGPDAGRYRGCRIGADMVCGFAAMDLRAGANPPTGRDERIQFLLNANELDLLIIELSGIRAELLASQIPGTAARERASPCAQ